MLLNGQLIPPLTLCESNGHLVHGWDFRQKRNLVIGFCDADCLSCEAFIAALVAQAKCLAERDATALLVFPAGSSLSIGSLLPQEVIAGTAIDGCAIAKWIGENAVIAPGVARHAIFVTDRYGEIFDHWVFQGHEFPDMDQILNALDRVEMACEECGDPPWPEHDTLDLAGRQPE